MLRIGVIAKVKELPKICSSISGMIEVQFIGFHSLDDSKFTNNHARFNSINDILLATDAIYISSNAANEKDVLEVCIKSQIHTLVEFPFIIDAERGNFLMNLALEANVKLQVGNPLKFTPVYQNIKDRFDSPMFIESQQLQSLNTELTNTSVIQNLMIKDIDVILSIVQSPVKKISANGVAVVNGTPDITNARILALLGDSVTTDHISPAGAIKTDSPAGKYLYERQVDIKDFNSYGSRRGNHEIMMRGTFANIRIKNEIIPDTEGGITKFFDTNEQMSIYDAAIEYAKKETPLVIFAGKEYGTGSSRDWAAKGTKLLGIKAVIAEGFERIHRSNLIGMGVLPLQFISNQNKKSLNLDGSEIISIRGLANIRPNSELDCEIESDQKRIIKLLCRIDTIKELDYYRHGGILQYVLNSIIKKAS